MNAEDFIVSFKRDMAALSRTERLRAIESVRDVLRAALFDDAAGVRYDAESCPRCGPARRRGGQVRTRGLSGEQICVMTGINDSDETFLAVSGRGSLSSKRAMDVLRGRVEAGSVVATDKAPACSRSSAWRRTRPTTPRTAPRARSTG